MSPQQIESHLHHSLNLILQEMRVQTHLASHDSAEGLPFEAEMAQIEEYINLAGEFGVAYEVIVANLERVPFVLSGMASVRLLEVGLLLRFKTERDEDKAFDFR